ncbi:MAG: HD domain-containing protein [Bacilli bacterium]|nr:HD domain-containing protein [Bacilli bacterium]
MFEYFLKNLEKVFNAEEVKLITKAYEFASKAHQGQKRKSGEPYIIHPLHVAYILFNDFQLHDANAIAAAFLHDTIEDTDVTFEDIETNFNRDIANLVLGVTDSSNIVFNSKTEEERFNNASILRNMMSDYRIIYIKLADRLHNMTTLEYQKAEKRISKAEQTLAFYVPMAYGIGASKAAQKIEDLCFQYLHPDDYNKLNKMKQAYEEAHCKDFECILNGFKDLLNQKDINMCMKNMAGIYNHMKGTDELTTFPGLIELQIAVDTKEECFRVVQLLKKNYPFDSKSIINHIAKARYDGYRGFSIMLTNVCGMPVSVEVYTHDMKNTNDYGFAIRANRLREKSVPKIQESISNGSGFMTTLSELGKYYGNDSNVLMHQVENELLSDNIRVYTPAGDAITLPKGATVLDFAYRIHTNLGNNAIGAYVNNNLTSLDFTLQDNDSIRIIKDSEVRRDVSDVNKVVTTRARRMIEKYAKK